VDTITGVFEVEDVEPFPVALDPVSGVDVLATLLIVDSTLEPVADALLIVVQVSDFTVKLVAAVVVIKVVFVPPS